MLKRMGPLVAPNCFDGAQPARHSQLAGGVIWGVSSALHEQAVIDWRSGRPMNPNLAECRVSVNADVSSVEAILVEEHNPYVNALVIRRG
jgi:xanthine dehydrogenase YagR molybdenum-binding subunit